MQVILTHCPESGFSNLLDGGQDQSNQEGENPHDEEHFQKSNTGSPEHGSPPSPIGGPPSVKPVVTCRMPGARAGIGEPALPQPPEGGRYRLSNVIGYIPAVRWLGR